MRITIIGSFRKYYADICGLIGEFQNHGIEVLSPQKSFIVDEIEGFVILNTDEKNEKPFIIQEHVFENIKKSEIVYVWNPKGYLGNSTCYEIGKIMGMEKPIIFKEFPKDLPIRVENAMIKNTKELIAWLNNTVFEE